MNDTTITLIGLFGALTILGVVNIIFGGGDITEMMTTFISSAGAMVILSIAVILFVLMTVARFLPWFIIAGLLWYILKK